MQTHYAQSLGALEGTPQEVWWTSAYTSRYEPTVFFGLYDLRDYYALWRHQAKAWVLWAGSDIRNLQSGFVFNDGKLGTLSRITRGWFSGALLEMLKKAEHWTENDLEASALERLGLKVSGVCPSYMGSTDLRMTYKPSKTPNVYLSASEGRQEEYGFDIVERIASSLPNMRFHMYGASFKTKQKNVIVHGRVPKEQMNKETDRFQIGLRLNEFDGFSEILAKAVLRGQYAVGKVRHPRIPSFRNDMDLITTLNTLRKKKEPNKVAMDWYKKSLNKFPWNMKRQ